jgi:hypothetical protein
MAKNSSNILALGVGLNLDPLNQDIANAAKTTKEGMAVVGQSVVDGGNKASGATENLGNKVQTMRQQLRQATQDTQAMAEKFGIMSTQAIASATRAGELKDKIGDINTVITAFSADSKFTVVAGALQSAAGAASIVTGAMGLLGTESKATQEMLLKVQSALALTQGLASIKEMGASFTALRAVIVGQVIPSIAAMGTATIVATGGVVLVLGAIITSVMLYTDSLDKEANALKLVSDEQERNKKVIADTNTVLIETQNLRTRALKDGLEKELRLNKDKLVTELNDNQKAYADGEIGLVSYSLRKTYIQDFYANEEDKIRKAANDKTIADTKKHQEELDKLLKNRQTAVIVDLSVVRQAPQPELQPMGFKGAKAVDMSLDLELLLAEQMTESHSERMQAINQDMWAKLKNIKEQGLNNVFGNLGEALGSTIAQSIQGENVDMFGSLRDAILISIADMAMATGTALVAAGVALMLDPMTAGFTGAATKIAAGTALIAAGSLAKGLIKGGSKGATAPPIPNGGGGGNNSNMSPNSNYIGGANSGSLVIEGYVRGNDINFVNGKSGSKNNRSLRFG